MFFYKVESHMPKLSSFGRGKKFRPKKSLTSLLHAALQLFPCLHAQSTFVFEKVSETNVSEMNVTANNVTCAYKWGNIQGNNASSKMHHCLQARLTV